MFDDKEVYTVSDLARILKCSTKTIRRIINSGQMDSITVKSSVRVCGWQANQWIEKQTGVKISNRPKLEMTEE